jgi:predicted CoA-binding protein
MRLDCPGVASYLAAFYMMDVQYRVLAIPPSMARMSIAEQDIFPNIPESHLITLPAVLS